MLYDNNGLSHNNNGIVRRNLLLFIFLSFFFRKACQTIIILRARVKQIKYNIIIYTAPLHAAVLYNIIKI